MAICSRWRSCRRCNRTYWGAAAGVALAGSATASTGAVFAGMGFAGTAAALSSNTEKDILRAGFHVNSYKEQNVYNGSEIEFTSLTSKDYRFHDEIWEKVDSSILSEKSCCLAKTPFLPELWDLFVNSDNDDDRMGALVLMYQKHFSGLE